MSYWICPLSDLSLSKYHPVHVFGTIAKLHSFCDSVVFHCVHIYVCASVSVCTHGRSVASDSLRPHGLGSARLFCPRNSLGKNTGVDSHFFSLQGMFPSWQSYPHLLWLLRWQADSFPLSHPGSAHLLFLNKDPHIFILHWTLQVMQQSLHLGQDCEHKSNLSRGTRPCSKHSTCIKASPTTTSLHDGCWSLYQLHFRDEDARAQRGEATCQGSQS